MNLKTLFQVLGDLGGCTYCGGLGHRITACPKLESVNNKKAGEVGKQFHSSTDLTLTYVLMKIFSGGKAGLFGWCYGRLLKSSTNPILQPSVAMHFPCVQSVWTRIFLFLNSVFAEMLVLCPSNCMQRLLPRFSPAYILSSSFSSTTPSIEDHHEFTVPSFGGKLEVNSRIPVEVVPSCPQTFPNMDRAFIKVLRSPGL